MVVLKNPLIHITLSSKNSQTEDITKYSNDLLAFHLVHELWFTTLIMVIKIQNS